MISFGGYYLDESGVRVQLPYVENPTDEDIEKAVIVFEKYLTGGLSITNESLTENDPCYKISVDIEDGNCLLMMLDEDEDGRPRTRTIFNKDVPQGFMPIGGEPFPRQAITRDLNLVASVLKEYARTGNVSEDLMC